MHFSTFQKHEQAENTDVLVFIFVSIISYLFNSLLLLTEDSLKVQLSERKFSGQGAG